MKEYVIYKLTRKSDGLIYIGTTNTKCFNTRMSGHRISKRFENDSFTIEILEKSSDPSIHDLEEKYIEQYDSFHNGLNESIDGKGNHLTSNFTTEGYKFSDESRKKMSEVKKGCIPWNKGKKNCFSEETIKKFSRIRKGKQWKPTKLNEDDVLQIRKRYDEGECGDHPDIGIILKSGYKQTRFNIFCKFISQEYSCTENNIKNIIKRKTWKHV